MLVARLLIESGAEIPYVGSACPKTPWSAADAAWLEAKGVQVKFRASLEDDCAAMEAFQPNLAIGTTPVVQKAKELAIPGLYFTNLISARPLMGPAGAGSLAEVVNAAIAGKARMDKMRDFFEGSVKLCSHVITLKEYLSKLWFLRISNSDPSQSIDR